MYGASHLTRPDLTVTHAESRRSAGCNFQSVRRKVVVGVLIILLLSFVAPSLTLAWGVANPVASKHLTEKTDARTEPAPRTTHLDVEYAHRRNAWLLPGQAGKAAVILAPGWGANRSERLDIAEALQARGYTVLAIDFGYISGGHYTGGTAEGNDFVSAIRWIGTRDPGLPVVLFGLSAGGHAAVLAATRARVNAVVTEGAPVDEGNEMRVQGAQTIHVPRPLVFFAPLAFPLFSGYRPVDLRTRVARTYAVPTLVIQGANDHTVPPWNGRTLSSLVHGTLWTLPHADHGQGFILLGAEYIDRITQFIDRAVASKHRAP